MIGARPEQAVLTRDTDMTKIEQTRSAIETWSMVSAIMELQISAILSEQFRWVGNQGSGTKGGLRAFQETWQKPF